MTRGSLSRFCIEVVLLSSLFALLFVLVGAPYFKLIAAGANRLLSWVDAPYSASVQVDGSWTATRLEGQLRYERPIDESAIQLLLLGAILLPSLLLATPIRWQDRLRLCALGGLLFLALQTLQVAVYLRSLGWEAPRSPMQESIVSVIYSGGTLLPVLLWPLLALRPFLRSREQVTQPETPARNVACPCSSGRKYKRCCGAPGAVGERPRGDPQRRSVG